MTFRTSLMPLSALLAVVALASVGCAASNEEGATGSDESNQTAANWKQTRIGDRSMMDMLEQEQVQLTLDANGHRHGLYFGADHRNHYVDFSKGENVVIDNGGEGTTARLALDAQGQPHIAYSFRNSISESVSQVKHVFRKNGQWTSEAVGVNGAARGIGFDASGTLHIASSANAGSTVSTLKPNGTFEHATVAGEFNAFVVDKNGTEYALLQTGQHSSQFARRTSGGQFSVEQMDPSLSHSAGSLAVDNAGAIHAVVAATGLTPGAEIAPHYIHRGTSDTTWSAPERIDTDGFWSSVAVDASGGVQVAFTGNRYDFASYAKRNQDGTWAVEQISGSQDAAIPSLVIDASGKPAFAYRDLGGYYLAEPAN